MTGVLLTVAYDGTEFSGWATQRDARTVEDALRGALLAVDPKAAGPRGSSRTDAGVHAEGQLAAFDASLPLPARGWVLALNQHLPDDVSVRAAQIVTPDYNPRFTSKKKRYRYRLLLDKVRDPLLRHRTWRIGYEMDLERLAREARAIVGTHDFKAFRSAGDERDVTTRTIHDVTVRRDGEDARCWSITIEGNAFLYNMVRILVGTLVDVARGHLPEGTIARALDEKDRARAGQTAPAHGLTLEHIDVDLPEEAGERWPP
ncbi:MAG: tRNA pseudouridine(38-40) synthase TruA [Labilithrix sp.]|nr:tRNA pseudouridine(38-40) synthase TruA [Labilithrix sp.]